MGKAISSRIWVTRSIGRSCACMWGIRNGCSSIAVRRVLRLYCGILLQKTWSFRIWSSINLRSNSFWKFPVLVLGSSAMSATFNIFEAAPVDHAPVHTFLAPIVPCACNPNSQVLKSQSSVTELWLSCLCFVTLGFFGLALGYEVTGKFRLYQRTIADHSTRLIMALMARSFTKKADHGTRPVHSTDGRLGR